MSTDTLATPGKIAGYLPPYPGTGWAREDVWAEHSSGGQWGDYAVGWGASARFTYTLPCGTRRLCMDDSYFVEPWPEGKGAEDATEFTVLNRYECREEELRGEEWEEVRTLDVFHDYGSALAWYTLASAEREVHRLAKFDARMALYAHVRF